MTSITTAAMPPKPTVPDDAPFRAKLEADRQWQADVAYWIGRMPEWGSTPDQIATAVKLTAQNAHAQYPQYARAWDGPEWHLVQLTKTVKTKAGVAFEKGDFTIARFYTPAEKADYARDYGALHGVATPPVHVMAYSVRNGIDTSIPVAAVKDVV